jgi:hypothetical protein
VVAIAAAWAVVQRLRPVPPAEVLIARPAAESDHAEPPVPKLYDAPLEATVPAARPAELPRQSEEGSKFSCDGRVYCSQMTSCAEAKFFLAHCPGTKMDGDGDGIPCERQFCGTH